MNASLVYRSDTVALKTAGVASMAPKGSHSRIVYPMAAIKTSRNMDAVRERLWTSLPALRRPGCLHPSSSSLWRESSKTAEDPQGSPSCLGDAFVQWCPEPESNQRHEDFQTKYLMRNVLKYKCFLLEIIIPRG